MGCIANSQQNGQCHTASWTPAHRSRRYPSTQPWASSIRASEPKAGYRAARRIEMNVRPCRAIAMAEPHILQDNLGQRLESLYHKYDRRDFVHPDPLEFLYEYDCVPEREVVGLIASSLAFGRVAQILNSVRKVLSVMGPSPTEYLNRGSLGVFRKEFAGFVHRYADAEALSLLLEGARLTLRRYGTLERAVAAGMGPQDESIVPGMRNLVGSLSDFPEFRPHPLVTCPSMGSACKRHNLFFRWMVRHDNVDPGGWDTISPALLIVPLDTHLYRVSRELGLTERNQADLKCALEITRGFGRIAPQDPVRFDFALTRPGIWASFGTVHDAPGGDEDVRQP